MELLRSGGKLNCYDLNAKAFTCTKSYPGNSGNVCDGYTCNVYSGGCPIVCNIVHSRPF